MPISPGDRLCQFSGRPSDVPVADKEFKLKTCCDTLFFVHIYPLRILHIYIIIVIYLNHSALQRSKTSWGKISCDLQRAFKGAQVGTGCSCSAAKLNVHEYCRLLAANVSILRMRSKNNLFQLGRP